VRQQSIAHGWLAFVQRLGELAWVEDRTVLIEYRWADGLVERAAEIAAEFVRLSVNVIVTAGDAQVLAAKRTTSVIPIVIAAAGDPVGNGLVASLARPGGNVTGLSLALNDTAGKRLELLREAVPGLRRVAILFNAANRSATPEHVAVQAAARALGLDTIKSEIRRSEDIVPAIESLSGRAEALYVCIDPLVNTQWGSHQRVGAHRATARHVQFSGEHRSGRSNLLRSRSY
jgi:putative tryptophan/tyrosine transport system substrate-binding protein